MMKVRKRTCITQNKVHQDHGECSRVQKELDNLGVKNIKDSNVGISIHITHYL